MSTETDTTIRQPGATSTKSTAKSRSPKTSKTRATSNDCASIDAKLAVQCDGTRLEGEQLQAFLINTTRLRTAVKASRESVWAIGNILLEIKPVIRKKEYHALLKDLNISRSSAERYLLVRQAFHTETDLPSTSAMELYAAARERIPADQRKQRAPVTDRAGAIAKNVVRQLSEFVQRIKHMPQDQRLALAARV